MTGSDLYDEYHTWKSWDQLFIYSADHAGYFAAELRDVKIANADVLEIGFGSGACAAWMRERGARVSLTEISELACDAAREAGYDVVPADLPSVAQDYDAHYDTIIAFDVFEHLDLDQVAQFLDACAVMLRPGGKLLLRFPNAQSPFGLKPQMGDPTHKSFLSRQVFELIIAGGSYRVARYTSSFLYLGRPLLPVWFKRSVRRALQKMVNATLNFIYATSIPYEPAVVIVLERSEDTSL